MKTQNKTEHRPDFIGMKQKANLLRKYEMNYKMLFSLFVFFVPHIIALQKRMLLLLVLCAGFRFSGISQNIAINTTNTPANLSAILDVSATNKGLLIPRMTLCQRTTPSCIGGLLDALGNLPAAAQGLIVYQTDGTQGFYYNTSATVTPAWAFLLSGSSGWATLGNAGTVAGTNFVGTTDAVGLDFRTSNIIRMSINSGGNVGINVVPSASYQLYVSSAINSIRGTSTSATNMGVDGFNSNINGTGVIGTGNNIVGSYLAGGSGGAFASTNVGVYGYGNNTALSYGVYGNSANATGSGVEAYQSVGGATVGFGLFSQAAATGGSAVGAYIGAGGASYFANSAVSGTTISTLAGVGVIGACDNASGRGVQGQSAGSSGYGGYFVNSGNIAGAAVSGGHTASSAGTGFTIATARGAIEGQGAVAGSYGFGVIGSGGTSSRSGGILGDDYNTARGSLGYYSSGLVDYGVYAFGNYVLGGIGGRMMSGSDYIPLEPNDKMIGLGICGGVMGGWIRGAVYGANIKGSKKYYSLYVDGKTYTNNTITQLETTENGSERIATYVSTSLSVDITQRGVAALQNGKTFVPFKDNFKELVSEKEPIMVTATPNNSSNGIYISSVRKEGFYVVENNNGTSNVQFTWIATGTKKGQEEPTHAAELMSLDFDSTMNGVMFNDIDSTRNGTPIWWDGTKVRHDTPPKADKPNMFFKMSPAKTRKHKNIDVRTTDMK